MLSNFTTRGNVTGNILANYLLLLKILADQMAAYGQQLSKTRPALLFILINSILPRIAFCLELTPAFTRFDQICFQH